MRHSFPLVLLLGLGGCLSPGQSTEVAWIPRPATDLGSEVARVGQVPIYAHQVLAEAKRSGKPARQALDDLVTTYILAERARRDGWRLPSSSEPEVASALVQRMLDVELEPSLRPEAVPDSRLRPIYERSKDRFVHPRLVNIGILAIYTGARMKTEPRLERQRTAEELAAFVKDHPPASLKAFAALAREPEWAKRKVVYDHFLQSVDRPLSRDVGQEIQKLHSAGATTGLLSDEDGFYIARYIDEQAAKNITFEQARPEILAAFYHRWQELKFSEYTTNLMKAHKVVAYFERLVPNEQGP